MRNNDILAFPNQDELHSRKGMTLRDYFAAKAMATILDFEGVRTRPEINSDDVTKAAYEIADAMLEARAK